MMTTVYGAYPVPAVSDSTHIEHVMAAVPYRKWEKQRDKEREVAKNKKRRNDHEGQFGEPKEKVPGQIGCFFEAKA